MSVKLLTEHHSKFLSLKGGCTGSSESTPVKMPHCCGSNMCSQLHEFYSFLFNYLFVCLFIYRCLHVPSGHPSLVPKILYKPSGQREFSLPMLAVDLFLLLVQKLSWRLQGLYGPGREAGVPL